MHLIVKQAITGEIRFHLFYADGELLETMKPITFIDRIILGIGGRQALERICYPDLALYVTVCLQHRSHENRRSATPDPAFDEITRNMLMQNFFNAALKLTETFATDHCLRLSRPIHTLTTRGGVVLCRAEDRKSTRLN